MSLKFVYESLRTIKRNNKCNYIFHRIKGEKIKVILQNKTIQNIQNNRHNRITM